MRRFVLIHQAKRLIILLSLQPLQAFISNNISNVTCGPLLLAVYAEQWIKVFTLSPRADKYVIMVKAGWLAFEVPLADYGSLVTGLLQQLGKRLLRAIKSYFVVNDTVDMTVFTGKDYGPAGRTDTIGTKAVFEKHTLFGEPIEVWCLVNPAAVTAHSLRSVVIGHNKNNVRLFCLHAGVSKFAFATGGGNHGRCSTTSYKVKKLATI
jgi:hypothetical protein